MKIEKLKSGHYRIRKTVSGVRYALVVDYKPTNREAMLLIEEKIRLLSASTNDTFLHCAEIYIQSKSSLTTSQNQPKEFVISPSTVRKY